jgi:hypothetical protein
LALAAEAKNAGIEITKIGIVSNSSELKFGATDTISIEELVLSYESCIPSLMAI